MDVSGVITQVATASSLVQVLEPAPGGFDVPVDSGTEFYTLLSGLVTGERVHALTVKQDETLPNIVYRLGAIDSLELDGYRLTQTDRYVLTVRTATYDALLTLVNDCIAAFRTSSYSIEPIDMDMQHEPEWTTQGAYRADIEVEFSYPVDSAGGPIGAFSAELPLALVYPMGRVANGDSILDFSIRQEVQNQYAIVLMTTGSDMATLQDEVRDALLGHFVEATRLPMQYVSGANLGGVGTMKMWREIYQDSVYFKEV